MNTTQLCGIDFYRGNYDQCLSELKSKITSEKPTLVVTPNPEMLYEASRDENLLQILQKADMAIPDGAGIFVAYQIRNSSLPSFLKYALLPYWCLRAIFHDKKLESEYGERITGSRLTRDLLKYANEIGAPVTIIDPVVYGNTIGDNAKRASQESIMENVMKKYPHIHLNVIVSDTVPEDMPEYGMIFATHGNGRQEKILSEIIKKYPRCGVAMGVGGSIDLITGFRSPAPAFFQRFGGEWLYRLYKNPKRHYRRMKKVIKFIFEQI